jgi:hypothetical protein
MNNVLQWILISVLSSVIILILVYNAAPTLFKFDFISFVSQTPANLGDIFQPKDLTAASQYEGFELSYDGMVLEKDAGYDNIDQVLKANISIPDCSICPSGSCQPVDFNNDGTNDTYKCPDCGICNGISQPNRFKNCLGCNITTETCIRCTDTDKEYALCNKIKETCILSQYRENNQNGCYIGEIPHNDGTSFNINTLLNVLSSCKSESLVVNMGNDFMKELCYFNSSSISYYDFERPNDFYLSYSVHSEGSSEAQSDSLNLAPFYKEGEETLPKYRIYVAINGTPDKDYSVFVGKFPIYCFVPPIQWSKCGYQAKGDGSDSVGTIHTDATGFGYTEIIELPDQAHAWDMVLSNPALFEDYDWKKEPEKYPIKGVSVSTSGGSSPQFITATFYANKPESNGLWTNELRYPNCNFNTDIEPYLKDRPWWASNPDNLNSSWYITNGNPNSSIKVFYDSSMPSGGNSLNRGNIKLQLGKLDVDFQRNCKFDIYVCSQDAFAEYEGESILNLNDFLNDFSPINVYKTSSFGNNQIILYNYFDFNLDKEYTVEELKSAIKTGFRNWEQNLFPYLSSSTNFDWLKNNDGIYQGRWNELSGLIKYYDDCWNDNIYSLVNNNDERFLIGNCKDNVCTGKIKIRIAFKYRSPYNLYPEKYPLYPTVTFCSVDSEVIEPLYTGMIGSCEEAYPTDSTPPSDLCQYSWGSGSCSGNSCVCNSGTKTTIFDSYVWNNNRPPAFSWPWEHNYNGYGYLYACIDSVSGNVERPVGSCTMQMNEESTTKHGCNQPTPWGDAYCVEAGPSSVCSASVGANLKYAFTNYLWDDYTSSYGYGHTQIATKSSSSIKKIVGSCEEVYPADSSPPPNVCKYAWGKASCSGNTCTCSEGTKTVIVKGYAWNQATSSKGYGYLYGCVA